MPAKVYFKAMDDEEGVIDVKTKKKVSSPRSPRSPRSNKENEPSKDKSTDEKLSIREFTDDVEGDGNSHAKRFSFRLNFRDKKDNDLVEPMDTEEDPVISLFRSRTTQRVRFSLEGCEPIKEAPKEKVEYYEKSLSSPPSPGNFNIKNFMRGSLFGKRSKDQPDDFEKEVAKEIESAKKSKDNEIAWESTESDTGPPEVVRTQSLTRADKITVTFEENMQTRAQVIKLLNKARRAQYAHFKYQYAVNCYMKALDLLTRANYPDDHPTVVKTMQSLNNAHHALSSYKNSANIVKMGIKYEDSGDLIRALKMFTIAYRIRRDNLSRIHPSLVILLNMLGSIQVKRGELEEAMQIYELALNDTPVMSENEDEEVRLPMGNLLTRSVTFREIGTIYERWGELDQALKMYHNSLDCVAEYKGISEQWVARSEDIYYPMLSQRDDATSVCSDSKSYARRTEVINANARTEDSEAAGLELCIRESKGRKSRGPLIRTPSNYDVFFPPLIDSTKKKKGKDKGKKQNTDKNVDEKKKTYADVDLALTIHQIAQLHRKEGEYSLALAAYYVALRGMRFALGKNHPNVAAILGNIGNLQKEMGDMDSAFETYQQVLAIESFRLGLSHPDVAITLHNIATIDGARGNNQHALSLYRQVLSLQRKLLGQDHESVAVTSACMGDIYEKIGDSKRASGCYEEALRIKMTTTGRHSLEVARILHKLGKLAVTRNDYHLANSFISRTILIYRLNKLTEDDRWVIDAYRDAADIDAAIAVGQGNVFEC